MWKKFGKTNIVGEKMCGKTNFEKKIIKGNKMCRLDSRLDFECLLDFYNYQTFLMLNLRSFLCLIGLVSLLKGLIHAILKAQIYLKSYNLLDQKTKIN